MKGRRILVAAAVLALAACGGGDEGENTGEAVVVDTPNAATLPSDTAGLRPGTVDSAGVGTNPPTAGGQLVDTAAVPGPVDTTAGTPTAP
ncbi:MAG TPA: hypothetical protein VF746_24900 [Longimicrobium sp.]